MFEHRPDAFFDAFSNALAGDDAALAPWWLDEAQGMAGLSIYRNTVCKGLADAVAASFPSVLAVVGPDWLCDAAIIFAQTHPPVDASLVSYGATFPAWLAAFEPARQMPFLPDLARLDRLWTEAHLAADSVPLSLAALGGLSPETSEGIILQMLPSVRMAMFEASIPDLWVALRGPQAPDAFELEDEPQAILIWRPYGEVQTRSLMPAVSAFLEACLRGQTLAVAADIAARQIPVSDLPQMFADLISSGVFAAVIPLPTDGASNECLIR